MSKGVALVTGSNRGIGRSTIEEFAKAGLDVVINYCHHEDEALELEKYIRDNYDVDVMVVKCDVSKEEEVEEMVNNVVDYFGRIDILVNNASVCRDSLLLDKSIKEFRRVLDVNLIGTYLCSKYVGRVMLENKKGKIINISSTSGLYGTPKLATYCMSKWGILGLTKTLAKEVGSKGIIVNALCPTKVKTPMCETMEYVQFINDLTGKDFKSVEEMYNGVPFLDVEDISSMVYWLGTSREAGKFNGREVALDLGTLQ